MALVVATLPTAANGVARSTGVVLEGRNVFRTSRTSVTTLHFPRPVDASLVEAAAEGSGRVYGFLLKESPAQGDGDLASVMFGRCTRPACPGRGEPEQPFGFGIDRKMSGTWHLYVIADGRPVTVTIRLRGLSGRTFTRPSGEVESEIKTLTPRVVSAGDENVYSAGDFSEVGGGQAGFTSYAIWVRGARHAGTAAGDCVYHEYNPVTPPPEAAFVPGCPTTGFYWTRFVEGDGGDADFQFGLTMHGGAGGIGGWFATSATPVDTGGVAVFLDA
ncbi:MAG TPA: hypothetical protein VHN37_02480 [Actinomycetota bacterium]|nr:hypothetical protein [Actinomycetota bacterium]